MRHSGRLLIILCTFKLRPMSRMLLENIFQVLKFFHMMHICQYWSIKSFPPCLTLTSVTRSDLHQRKRKPLQSLYQMGGGVWEHQKRCTNVGISHFHQSSQLLSLHVDKMITFYSSQSMKMLIIHRYDLHIVLHSLLRYSVIIRE